MQGVEAGGHRGGFDDSAPGDVGLLALLQLVRAALADLPLVATGGIATGGAVAAVLAAGAAAAQLGTAFTLCPEAATVPAHRVAITDGSTGTAVTRAFTGRAATPTAFTCGQARHTYSPKQHRQLTWLSDLPVKHEPPSQMPRGTSADPAEASQKSSR